MTVRSSTLKIKLPDLSNRFFIVAVFLLVLTAGYLLPQIQALHLPGCPFFELTGLQCPGCGSTRAVNALLHGSFAKAWHYNALAVLLLPFVTVSVLYNTFLDRDLLVKLRIAWLGWLLLGIIILWWILRNVL
jgi:hypothetical protein